MVVLVGAGLLVRTLQNLRNVDVGFDSHNILIFGIDPTLIGYNGAQVDSFYRDLQGRLCGNARSEVGELLDDAAIEQRADGHQLSLAGHAARSGFRSGRSWRRAEFFRDAAHSVSHGAQLQRFRF